MESKSYAKILLEVDHFISFCSVTKLHIVKFIVLLRSSQNELNFTVIKFTLI